MPDKKVMEQIAKAYEDYYRNEALKSTVDKLKSSIKNLNAKIKAEKNISASLRKEIQDLSYKLSEQNEENRKLKEIIVNFNLEIYDKNKDISLLENMLEYS